jgi:hypothetical protein
MCKGSRTKNNLATCANVVRWLENLKEFEVMGKKAQGQRQLRSHLEGKRLSCKQAILAKCYECTCGYVDGRIDCQVPKCPLYAFMPFGSARKKVSNLLEYGKNA